MKSSKRILSALLTGVVICGIFASSGCNTRPESPVLSEETTTSSSITTTASSLPSGEPEITETTLSEDEIRASAGARAEELGLTAESLNGQYSFFLEYADLVEDNPKFGEFSEYLIRLFPIIAEHIKDENKTLFLDKLSELEILICDIESGGAYDLAEEKLYISDKYSEWEEEDTCFIIYHEMFHFLDRYINGMEQYALYTDNGFTAVKSDLSDMEDGLLIRAGFAEEGMADLWVAKTLSKSYDSYYVACNFLTAMEYIYGSDMVEDILFSNKTTLELISLFRDLGYDDQKIVKIITDLDAYTYDFEEAEPTVYSFEDIMVDMYQKEIGPDFQEDPVFCYLLYNQSRAYVPERTFSGEYLHSRIPDVIAKEEEKMHARCDTINKEAEIFQDKDDPETRHAVFFLNGDLLLSERTWTLDEDDEYEMEIHLIKYDFKNESVLDYKKTEKLELPGKLHEDLLK